MSSFESEPAEEHYQQGELFDWATLHNLDEIDPEIGYPDEYLHHLYEGSPSDLKPDEKAAYDLLNYKYFRLLDGVIVVDSGITPDQIYSYEQPLPPIRRPLFRRPN